MPSISSITSALLLAFGFGFVIFFHELGHFLAAKWADVKVEQFAVGFGQALVSWRKGMGFRWGSTQTEYLNRLEKYLEDQRLAPRQFSTSSGAVTHSETEPAVAAGAATFGDLAFDHSVGEPTAARLSYASAQLGISETEYRLNWIPLGGYVKMLGQDDLKPGVTVEDPRAYNNKSIAKRMVIVSAGVVMNVILAFVGFMFIFWVGFKAAPPVVGSVEPGSPAQQAFKVVDGHKVVVGLQPGDRILYLDNKYQYDFEKIGLNTALLTPGPIPLYVKHRDGTDDHLTVVPTKPPDEPDFPRMGISPAFELRGVDSTDVGDLAEFNNPQLNSPELRVIQPGDTITAINGEAVSPNEFWKLQAAMQNSGGKPVPITIRDKAGQERTVAVQPHFMGRFDGSMPNFAGMLMRPQVENVMAESKARGMLLPGDVITAFSEDSSHPMPNAQCTREALMKALNDAGQHGSSLSITVLRDGKTVTVNVSPKMRVSPERYGLGIGLGADEATTVVAGTVDDSPAAKAGIPAGALVTAINGHPVSNWYEVNAAMAALTPADKLVVSAQVDGKPKTFDLGTPSPEQIADAESNRLAATDLALASQTEIRKTRNLLTAAQWGVGETRDAILQVYQTFRAMASRSISVKQVSSFVGIAAAGYKFAEMGIVRLVWFLSIIGANLAVMNFLPIPIVDGGLFTFLIIEKVKGSPVSQRVQAIAQVVGLAILLSVFLFATYQDVFYRLPFLSR